MTRSDILVGLMHGNETLLYVSYAQIRMESSAIFSGLNIFKRKSINQIFRRLFSFAEKLELFSFK